MPKQPKSLLITAAQLKKECLSYLKDVCKEIQYECQDVLAQYQVQIKKNRETTKKLQATVNGIEDKIELSTATLKEKVTKTLQNKVKTLNTRLKESLRKLKQLQKDNDRLKKQMESIKDFKEKEKAREAAMKAFEQTYKKESLKPAEPKSRKKTKSSKAAAAIDTEFRNAAQLNAASESKTAIENLPQVGSEAPEFNTLVENDQKISLSGYRGKRVILYFYPKDDTPGCSQQAKDFMANFDKFEQKNAVILGVSRDNLSSHCNFKEKYNIHYDLIPDIDETICQSYGVVKNKNLYGKQVRGIERSTFLIDENGIIQQLWRGVKVAGHVDDILSAIK